MNVVRTFLLLVIVASLAACAGKAPRGETPAATTQIAPSDGSLAVTADDCEASHPDDVTEQNRCKVALIEAKAAAQAGATAEDAARAAAEGPVDDAGSATATGPVSTDAVPTDAEDDFAALYGSDPAAGGNAANAASYDPWEGFNRKVHAFNVVVDRAIAHPLAIAYTSVVPEFARTGVSNFFNNLRAPVTLTNQLLQGRPADAWDTLARFLLNSTVGIGGLFDPASKAMMPRRSEDFGQTLGAWGWRRSRYVELPFFGPRTVRDVFGMAGDAPLSPMRTIEDDKVRIGLQGLQLVDRRAQLLAVDDMRANAVDEYALVRDAWLQRRNYQIENDLRSRHERDRNGHDDDSPIPVDAMPMPQLGN